MLAVCSSPPATWSPTASPAGTRWLRRGRPWAAAWAEVNYARVSALALSHDGNLYVGGYFTTAGGVNANNIARWDPATSSWSPLGNGMNGIVYALALDDAGNLYAGGEFTTAGGVSANKIARWDGAALVSIGQWADRLLSFRQRTGSGSRR